MGSSLPLLLQLLGSVQSVSAVRRAARTSLLDVSVRELSSFFWKSSVGAGSAEAATVEDPGETEPVVPILRFVLH